MEEVYLAALFVGQITVGIFANLSVVPVCPAQLDGTAPGSRYMEVTYSKLSDNVNVVNPGRGYYLQVGTKASNFQPLSNTALSSEHNVVLRLYYLDTFVHSNMTTAFIENIRSDLATVHDMGWTCILRFAYTDTRTMPYDAGLTQILLHIEQLGNSGLFQEYKGVISAVQAGFVGVWGEWHYASADFGQPGVCDTPLTFGLSPTQWDARDAVVLKLLEVVPVNIHIQVRIPAFKYHSWGSSPTTYQQVVFKHQKARIGFHNDAFLSDATNQGTFPCSNDKTYMEQDSKFTVVAGETNDDSNQATYECSVAISEMQKYHYSTINELYKPEVIQYWRNAGCFDAIAAQLGYRLYATYAIFPKEVKTGDLLCFEIHIRNEGFAAPYKDMDAYLYFQNSGSTGYRTKINVDVRTWLPSTSDYIVKGSTGVPHSVTGDYKIYLVMFDKYLPFEKKYYVLLANQQNHPSPASRMNDMLHTVSLTAGSPGSTVPPNALEAFATPECSEKLADGSFENNSGTSEWIAYGNGFQVQTGSAQEGQKYITVTDGGAYQSLDFLGSPVIVFTMGGYSRHTAAVSVHQGSDYSIYCDLVHTDFTSTYGVTQQFDPSSLSSCGWQFQELSVTSTKPILTALCYVLFRNGQGSVDFDNFKITHCKDACGYHLSEGSFETEGGWTSYLDGFTRINSSSLAKHGNSYISVSNGAARQVLNFYEAPVTHFRLSGYSRSNMASTTNVNDYSIYCDLQHEDNSNTWGRTAPFDQIKPGTEWQNVTLDVNTIKEIKTATCYTMFRNGVGAVDFDSFHLDTQCD